MTFQIMGWFWSAAGVACIVYMTIQLVKGRSMRHRDAKPGRSGD